MVHCRTDDQDNAKKYFHLADQRLGRERDLGTRRLRDETAKLLKLK